MARILVLYYSAYGHVETLASAVAEGARAGGAHVILLAFVLVLGTSHVLASPQGVASDSGGDWVYVDHDLAGTRYSHLKQITTKNVSQLVKACEYSFPDKEPSQTAPIVAAGRMYLTTAHYTVAVDAANCHVIWSSKWTPREHEPANTHRGAARCARLRCLARCPGIQDNDRRVEARCDGEHRQGRTLAARRP